ncbi:MAG: hypothetical protein HOK54_19975 [Alphaproteobacteria bacterium]|nr:hypothetical protein [Alphaproteobacteria bacterium]
MDFGKLVLAGGRHNAVFQALSLSFQLKRRLSGVLLISERYGHPNG